MLIKVIFAQRKEGYEGQYAPEALECMDEYGYDENPDWLHKKLAEYKKDNHLLNVLIIDVDIDGDKIRDLLVKTPRIDGEIQE